MTFIDRCIIFAGFVISIIQSRKPARVRLGAIKAGARECFGKGRWF